jgi:hypothetical protein
MGWINVVSAAILIAAGFGLFYLGRAEMGVAFVGFGGAVLGIGGGIANLTNAQKTNNEIAARQVEAMTQQPAQEIVAEAKVAAGEKPDPNAERQGRPI